jgi:mannose-1-phosphate guanylyltransferase
MIEQKLWGIVLAAGEGTRARDFLRQLCGGRGIKQFCAVIDSRSMLEHTLARVERLIPRERILVVVSQHHQAEVTQHLAHWPAENVIYQPANRDTAPGILLPLTYISQRDPLATVTVFPSDHFVVHEAPFLAAVGRAAAEVQHCSRQLILLGALPDQAVGDYGWIEPAKHERSQASRAVLRFVEKPSRPQAGELMARGALWNTFVFAARATTLWAMVRQTAPDLADAFERIGHVLRLCGSYAPCFTEDAYERMRAVNFSSGVCEPLVSWLRVLPLPDVGWSDWGTAERIVASLQHVGKLDAYQARLRHETGEWGFLPKPPKREDIPGPRT